MADAPAPRDVYVEVYYRHSDDYPPAQIMLTGVDDDCPEALLAEWLEEAEAAVEEQEEEGVYRVTLAGATTANITIDVALVAELEQTVALVCLSTSDDGDVEIHDAHIDPLMAAIDPDLMDAIASQAAEAVEHLTQAPAKSASAGEPMWVFVAV